MDFLEKKMKDVSLASELDAADPEAVKKDPEAVKKDPEAFKKDPEAVKKYPEAFKKDPEAVKKDPEAVKKDPEAVKEVLSDVNPALALEVPDLVTNIQKPQAAATEPEDTGVVVLSVRSAELSRSMQVLRSSSVLALDCEGVDLGRLGKTCLVQVSTRSRCFLFDVHEASATDDIVVELRSILENEAIVKVIHDCRQDADALFHHFHIRLVNVHDTQCWDKVLNYQRRNLNSTLMAFGLTPHVIRDRSVYATKPAFWADRPLTPMMIEWATGDVECLFALYDRQLAMASAQQKMAAVQLSTEAATEQPSWVVRCVYILPDNVGMFIGRGGCNIQALEASIPGIHLNKSTRSGELTLYAKDEATMRKLLAVVQWYQLPMGG